MIHPIVIHVSDPADPRLRDYANLTDAQLRAADWSGERGVFIAEGELVVRRLLASRFPIRSLLLTESGLERLADALPDSRSSPDSRSLAPSLSRSFPDIYLAPTSVLQAIVGFPFHRGILACGQRLPDPPLDQMLATCRTLLILEDLANVDNVGAIFRNAGALASAASLDNAAPSGAGILLSPGCCDPMYRKSLRVSMGQVLRVPFAKLQAWPETLDQISAAGFQVLALTPDSSAHDINSFNPLPNSRIALVLGAEGPGLSDAAFSRSTLRIRIPMAPGADSLNVATAAAIALSRLQR
jgi:tRNA G18 (ribose-2'-O)-methylase SpoU